jgi:hypothetical protein
MDIAMHRFDVPTVGKPMNAPRPTPSNALSIRCFVSSTEDIPIVTAFMPASIVRFRSGHDAEPQCHSGRQHRPRVDTTRQQPRPSAVAKINGGGAITLAFSIGAPCLLGTIILCLCAVCTVRF